MKDKKKTTRQFVEDMKALRKRRPDPALIDKFNKVVEKDEQHEQENIPDSKKKKIARDSEAQV